MKIPFLNLEIKKTEQDVESNGPALEVLNQHPYDLGGSKIYGPIYPVITRTFDGEKTPGELGVISNTIPDYQRLRLRSYDATIRTDLVKIISEPFFRWVIGSGLKLQAEPNRFVLELENITQDWPTFQKTAEARFGVYSKSKYSDFSKMNNLHDKALDAFKTAFDGGDCLVICRVEDGILNVQLIDGSHIKTPVGSQFINDVKGRGNFIKHGIELSQKGEHVAYYVEKINPNGIERSFERVAAYGEKSKRKMAWMIYGQKARVDHVRGIPAITQILEKINKLDRYTEAAVSKAEQAANISYTIEHDEYSTGENPVDEVIKKKLNVIGDAVDGYALADGLANRIKETTSNQVWNLPPGAKFKTFSSTIETDFEQFYRAVFNSLCASIGIPPEVALQMYNSNYSASRAAINAWDYAVTIAREKFANDFYKPIYNLWLELEILKSKIDASGYVNAINKGDFMVVESFAQCRFTGKKMPHIDPLKEIKAIRAMLGDETTPLISYEQATEDLGAGEWQENYAKNREEDKIIVKPEISTENGNQNTNA